jgi:hypothetical protein
MALSSISSLVALILVIEVGSLFFPPPLAEVVPMTG